ncbi:MAG: hypothetical protein HY526_07915 [Betaproteobacteria bacterium]|nr:hypothetical protein [Betaproteobacteria bacterium]
MKLDDPALRERLMGLYLNLNPYPEVSETLTRLKAGGPKLAILSNGRDAFSAKAFGLRVAWYNRSGQVPERIPERPDAEIARCPPCRKSSARNGTAAARQFQPRHLLRRPGGLLGLAGGPPKKPCHNSRRSASCVKLERTFQNVPDGMSNWRLI